jgi:hypothetical protein
MPFLETPLPAALRPASLNSENHAYSMTHRDQDRRLDANWFGSGYLSKARAYRLALTCAQAWRN